MKCHLADLLQLNLSGVCAAERVVVLLIVCHELEALKYSLQYAGGGSWQAFREEALSGERPTWAEFVKANAGITDKTQANYWRCYCEIFRRFKQANASAALRLMESRPSLLSLAEQRDLVDVILWHGLRPGETFSALLRSTKAPTATATETPPPMDTPPITRSPSPLDIVFQAEEIKRAALALGMSPGNAGRVAMMVLCRDCKATGNPRHLVRYCIREHAAGTAPLQVPTPPQA